MDTHCFLITSEDMEDILDIEEYIPNNGVMTLFGDRKAVIDFSSDAFILKMFCERLVRMTLRPYSTFRWAEIVMDGQGERMVNYTYKGIHKKNVSGLKVTTSDLQMLESYFADESIGLVQWKKLAETINAKPNYVRTRMLWLLNNAAPNWRSQSKEQTREEVYRQLEDWAYQDGDIGLQ